MTKDRDNYLKYTIFTKKLPTSVLYNFKKKSIYFLLDDRLRLAKVYLSFDAIKKLCTLENIKSYHA